MSLLSGFITAIFIIDTWIKLLLLLLLILAELRRPEAKLHKQPICGKQKENPWVDFLMVIMASGNARGRVHTTATTTTVESRNMTVILQITGWQRHAALVYCVLLWYWISILWSTDTCQNKLSVDQYRGLKLTAHRGQVFFWSWPLTRCWFFDWIAGSCLVNLLKTGQDFSGSRLMLTQD